MQDSGNKTNRVNLNRAKLVFRHAYSEKNLKTVFSPRTGCVHIFLLMGYRFKNELVYAKAIICARIN